MKSLRLLDYANLLFVAPEVSLRRKICQDRLLPVSEVIEGRVIWSINDVHWRNEKAGVPGHVKNKDHSFVFVRIVRPHQDVRVSL